MFDRVKMESTTTGTGAYTLGAALDGFRSLAAAAGAVARVVPYAVVQGTDYETGFGLYDGADPGTLQRTEIMASSNSGAPVNWAAGTKEVTIAVLAQGAPGAGLRHNWQATFEPGTAYDQDSGYSPGSLWRFGRRVFICASATVGAAVWIPFNPFVGVSGGLGGAYMRQFGGEDDPAPRLDFAACLYSSNPDGGFHCRTGAGLAKTFTPGTSTEQAYFSLPDGATAFEGTVLAVISAGANTGKCAAWRVSGLVRGDGTTYTIVGTPAVTAMGADSELTGATVAVSIVLSTYLGIDVTGIAATNIDWSVDLRLNDLIAP